MLLELPGPLTIDPTLYPGKLAVRIERSYSWYEGVVPKLGVFHGKDGHGDLHADEDTWLEPAEEDEFTATYFIERVSSVTEHLCYRWHYVATTWDSDIYAPHAVTWVLTLQEIWQETGPTRWSVSFHLAGLLNPIVLVLPDYGT